jgi:hypothetical protein
MNYFFDLLAKLRTKPGMFIGSPSVTRLAFFMRGWDYAMWQNGHTEPCPMSGFRDWIQRRYHCSTMAWEELILRDSTNEQAAFDKFWHLWDEYSAEEQRGKAATSTPLAPVA